MTFSENNFSRPEQQESLAVDLILIDPQTKERQVVATCQLKAGRVKIGGDSKFVHQLERGVKSYPDQKMITPMHGKEFLDAIQKQYRSAYLFAELKNPRERNGD